MNNNGVCVSTKTAIIFGIIFAAMVIFGIVSRNKNAAYAEEMRNYVEVVVPAARAYGDSMAKIADSVSAVADSAIKVSTIQSAEIKKLKTNVNILRGKNQDLTDIALADPLTTPAARAAIQGLQQEVADQQAIIVRYEALDSTQKVAIANLTIARDAQQHRADSLDIIVGNIPTPPGPIHVLGIKMPHIPKGVGYVAVAVGGYYIGTKANR